MPEPVLKQAAFVTFYSFKGGVGRSMALINVAGILAGRGFRVLAMDLDLEAPGISYLLDPPSGPGCPGFVELVDDVLTRGADADLATLPPVDFVERYSFAYDIPDELRQREDGLLRITPAGRLDDDYPARLDKLDLGRLYKSGQGKPIIDALKATIRRARYFDFVLIDSRTGFSDESGICTRDLGDQLIVVTGLNQQNVKGTGEFLAALRRTIEKPADKGLRVVLSPVPNGEDDLVDAREISAKAVFERKWGAAVDLSLRIPYHPRLALTEEPHVFRRSHGYLYDAYVRIERELTALVGLDRDSIEREMVAAVRRREGESIVRGLKLAGKLGLDVSPSLFLNDDFKRLLLDPGQSKLRRDLAAATALGYWTQYLARLLHGAGLDEADALYRAAIEGQPSDADTLGNYALFLREVRGDADGAEGYYKRALEADPKHANTLGNYASFLREVRGDADGAEGYYKRALEADPKRASTLGNYANFLFTLRRRDEAVEFLGKAFELDPTEPALLCRLHFYAVALARDEYPGSLRALKTMLERGHRSLGWPLDGIVRNLGEDGDPHADFIEALAQTISADAALDPLAEFLAWRKGHF